MEKIKIENHSFTPLEAKRPAACRGDECQKDCERGVNAPRELLTGFTGFSWFAGWLFTIGFLELAFWMGVLALIVWPYYLGQYVNAVVAN